MGPVPPPAREELHPADPAVALPAGTPEWKRRWYQSTAAPPPDFHAEPYEADAEEWWRPRADQLFAPRESEVPFEERDPEDGGMRQRHGRRELADPAFDPSGLPQDFFGTPLQREIFPEDSGKRFYKEQDSLPMWQGPLFYSGYQAAQLKTAMGESREEEDFWFRPGDTQDPFGYGTKMEAQKVETLLTDGHDEFDMMAAEIRDRPPAAGAVREGAEMTGTIVGAHIQYGIQVDLGCDCDGLVPTYHRPGELDSEFYEAHRDLWDREVYPGREVRVRVHAVRLQRARATGKPIYRFPIELELLDPALPLPAPVPADAGRSEAPVKLWSYGLEEWAEMFEVTGRRVPAELTQARLTDVRRGHEWTIRDKLIQFRRRFSIGDPDIQDDEIPELALGRAADPFAHLDDDANAWQLKPEGWDEEFKQIPLEDRDILGGEGPAKEIADLSQISDKYN